jgi:RimJ/RimL family protein N-acetyltransferase
MLRPGTKADLGFIRSLAQRPDYAAFITDESEEVLSGYLAAADYDVLIWQPEAVPAGFAIFCDIGLAHEPIMLMRLALAEAGRGEGKVFLRALLDHAFEGLKARRIWLDCSAENIRGQRAYLRAGFTLEGRLRAHYLADKPERLVDSLLYGILREEWQALEPLRAQA